MAQSSNPPSQLSDKPRNACLPRLDGIQFSAMLQSARLAANSIANLYPDITVSTIDRAYGSQDGQIKLMHLSAYMYSYWHTAPTGPSVFDIAAQQLRGNLGQLFREQCAAWDTLRLNSSLSKCLYVIEEGEDGSLVADHTMTKFYRVLGMKTSPAAALIRRKAELPVATRFTALPFRGHLVYDGIIMGAQGDGLSPEKKRMLMERSRAAKAAGNVITGFHIEAARKESPVSDVVIEKMSTKQLKQFVLQRGGSVSTCVERSDLVSQALSLSEKPALAEAEDTKSSKHELSKEQKDQADRLKKLEKREGMVVFRRFGYTEESNSAHMVTLLDGSSFIGSFCSKNLVPSASEILDELLKTTEKSGKAFSMIAVDDKETANAVNLVTKEAGIYTGFYPPPSEEEQMFSTLMGHLVK
ncbi:hypothetical protein FGB62_54g126 [Gracilaria domingensis]|nr:hypothetical protein FGB62_54g126 [Gracilaria domingensis]